MSEIETFETLNKLNTEQLIQVYNGLKQELQTVYQALQETKESFLGCNKRLSVLDSYGNSKPDEDMLLPIYEGLYAHGKTSENGKVLFDLGASYYAELTVDKAKQLVHQKQAKLQDDIEKYAEVKDIKEIQMNTIAQILRRRGNQ